MITDILKLIQDTYSPIAYSSIAALVAAWPPEVVDKINYVTLANLAQHISIVTGEA